MDKVKTVIFCPITFNLAEVTRMIEVAKALPSQYKPIFQGYENDYVGLIRQAGFEYQPAFPELTARQRQQALKFDQGKSLSTPFSEKLVSERVKAERQLIQETNAKAVVIGTNPTSMISARAENVPLFYPVPFALTRPQIEQTRHMGLLNSPKWADQIASSVFRSAYNHLPLIPKAFSQVSAENGLPPMRTVASLLEADENLLTVMPWELDGYDLPDSYTRVGPIFAHLDLPMPPIIGYLAEHKKPLIYLGLGSSANRKLVLEVVKRLAKLPINVIAPVGHYLLKTDELPNNIYLTELLPAHQLTGLVDAAILHGGQGTVQTACATGIPFIGMGLQPEQRWNVDICVRQGNALAVLPRKGGSPLLSNALKRILTEDTFRQSAIQIKEKFAAEDGAAAVARKIEAQV